MINTPASKRIYKRDDETPDIEPFPEPRTFPGGWDLSGMVSAGRNDDDRQMILPGPVQPAELTGNQPL